MKRSSPIRAFLTVTLAATLGGSAEPRPAEWRYLCTYGSREGIHPPRVLSRKAAIGAMGQAEHPYGLAFPVAVTTDLEQRVWITDSGTASVHVFDRTGAGYREIRRLAGTPLQSPAGIASDAQGRVYLTDAVTGGIYVFDEHGEYDHSLIRRGERLLESPSAIALSEDNKTIYVADPPRNLILALNREGEVNARIPLPAELGGATAIAVVRNQIHVMGGQRHKVGIFSPAGQERGELQWEGIAAPTAFAFDKDRNLFLAANPRWMVVQSFDEAGRTLGVFGKSGEAVDQMLAIDYLHVARNGDVYAVDSRHGKVLVFGQAPGR